MNSISDLLSLASAYAKAKGLSDATVSTRLFNDGKRLAQLQAGETDIGVKRLARAVEWLSANWPDGATWPEGVARPEAEAVSPFKPEAA